MRLAVEVFTGGLFYMEVNDNATLADLKKGIEDQEKLPYDRIILALDGNGNPLMTEDEMSLQEYGLKDGSRVYLFFSPKDDDDHGESPYLSLFQDSA